MTKTAALKQWEAGSPILLVEFRSTNVDKLRWRDKETGKALTGEISRHNLELGDRAVALEDRAPDGTTAAAATYANTSGDTATLTALLETFPGIAPGDVTVTRGTPAGAVTVFTIEFTGNLAGVNVPQLTNTESLTGGSGTLTHGTTTAGGGAGSDGSQTLVGFLFRAVTVPDTSDTSIDCAGALLTHGKVVSANLPVSVDAAGQADVAGRIRFV